MRYLVLAVRYLLAAAFGCALAWGIVRFVPKPWTLVAWLGFVAVGVYSSVFLDTKRPWYAIWNERFDRKPR